MRKLAWAAAGAVTSAFLLSKRLKAGEVDLTGQVVLVTGGSRGLGFALASEFARLGCRVAICVHDKAELERAAERIAAEGGIRSYVFLRLARCRASTRDDSVSDRRNGWPGYSA